MQPQGHATTHQLNTAHKRGLCRGAESPSLIKRGGGIVDHQRRRYSYTTRPNIVWTNFTFFVRKRESSVTIGKKTIVEIRRGSEIYYVITYWSVAFEREKPDVKVARNNVITNEYAKEKADGRG